LRGNLLCGIIFEVDANFKVEMENFLGGIKEAFSDMLVDFFYYFILWKKGKHERYLLQRSL
jgi:multisubunit Na+/H+ antiporter MnhB subunit